MNEQTEKALLMAIKELSQTALGDTPAMLACKAALEKPCQECERLKHDLDSYMKLAHAYANQKPLSDDVIRKICASIVNVECKYITKKEIQFARAIEKAHGIGVKND